MCCDQSELSRRRSPRRGRGFSLLEVMVVLMIIGLIVGLVSVYAMGQYRRARQKTAAAQIASIANAIDLFYLEHGRYPTNDEGLEILAEKSEKSGEPFMQTVPRDPWGNAYQYNSPAPDGRPFEVITLGADRQEGGDGADGDLSNWDVQEQGKDDA